MKETPSVPPRRLEIIGERDLGSTVAKQRREGWPNRTLLL